MTHKTKHNNQILTHKKKPQKEVMVGTIFSSGLARPHLMQW